MGVHDEWPRMGVVLAASAHGADAQALPTWLARHAEANAGRMLPAADDTLLAVFESLVDAMACAGALQQACAAQAIALRIGICRGEVRGEGPPPDAPVVRHALRLCADSAPGQVAIAPIPAAGTRLRMGAEPVREAASRQWIVLAAGVQLACLMGYFLGWYALITWKVIRFVEHGGSTCWPEWMC